ncbi:thioredoxin 1 [Mycoplasma testudineum]|uniref:Thioredoxin 1 n=1 Tax=Mycoplasma testudineum TaxID=244584 RepID=A0A4R6IDW1_9MOLU|nr:thioredoxin family protein [Mycoplasma testudineum]OYD26760.1 thiol reductase thioredoxin [Mycoplasma testudineum]TDO19896.1 thioredoxin 1 [Mycoplasma testudineum]
MQEWKPSKYKEVEASLEKGLKFVEFYTDWCGDCRVMKPIVTAIRDKYVGDDRIEFIKINAEEAQQYKNENSKFKIERIPTHLLIKDGKILNRAIEYIPSSYLEKWITDALGEK